MRIENLQPLSTYRGDLEKPVRSEGTGFADLLKNAIQEVNETEIVADNISEKFALGQIDNVHQVTIATEQARLALELTIAIRNKAVEAYKEIMRMQF